MWNLDDLGRPPELFPAPGVASPGVESLFYAGQPYQGKPTRVFAWYGEPDARFGAKVPAMVLVHGGGGTAFAEWVRLWTSRGYAAIAMDTCGSIGDGRGYVPDRPRHGFSGPKGWGGFDQVDQPLTDQWSYHAVADIVLAVSLLRAKARVDAARIGITGVSWGGYLTCLAAGVDPRLACAMPVYGCGFITEDSCWNGEFAKLGKEKTGKWHDHFDPATHLGNARMPMLWVNGTNDFAYWPHIWQKSYRLPAGPRTVCLKLRMPHGHEGPGENAPELHAFADQVLNGGPALARITGQGLDGRQTWATYDAPFTMHHAELLVTRDAGEWPKRKWDVLPAALDKGKRRVSAQVPEGAKAWFLNLTDYRGLIVSSEMEQG